MNFEVNIDGKKIKLAKLMVGGITDDETRSPCGMFGGDLDPVEACMMYEAVTRAFVKLLHEEGRVPFEEIGRLINVARDHAIKTERSNNKWNNWTFDEHQENVEKWSRSKNN